MGDYSVPAEICAFKPKGSVVKKTKGNYCVYSHSQSKDPAMGKWKTAPGALLGKIAPGVGYCPKGQGASEGGGVTCFDYGEYLLACGLAKGEFGWCMESVRPSLPQSFCFSRHNSASQRKNIHYINIML